MGSIDWECDHLQYGYQSVNTMARFGSFDGKKNVRLKLKDCDGNDVTFSLTGGGYGEVDPCDCAFSSITLYNTTEKSIFSIKTRGRIWTSVGNIICGGPLRSINAKTTAFDGSITIGPSSNPKAAVAITFDFSRDLSIDSAIPVKSIKAVEFVNSSLTAPSLGSITTKGDKKRNMMGIMNVDVNVPGAVGSVRVAGELSGDWDCNTIKSIAIAPHRF